MTEHEARSAIGAFLESNTRDSVGVFLVRSRTRKELASIEREEEDPVVVRGCCGESKFSRGIDRGGGRRICTGSHNSKLSINIEPQISRKAVLVRGKREMRVTDRRKGSTLIGLGNRYLSRERLQIVHWVNISDVVHVHLWGS